MSCRSFARLLSVTAVELLLLAGGGFATLDAQVPPVAPASPVTPAGASWTADSLHVARASVAWMQALQRRDTRALDTLMAADYRLTAPADTTAGVDKVTWIRNAQTILDTDSAAYRSMRYRAVAPDVIVGSGMLYWRTKVRGWPLPVRSFAVTDVWARQAENGRWQIVMRSADPAPHVLLTAGAMAGAALTGVLWMLTAWWRRRRRRGARSTAAPATS